MKKHAIMIIAHKNLDLVQELISSLDSELFDIFIHIDTKCSEKVELKTNKSKLSVFSKYSVIWGTFSIVKCELLLLNEALKSNEDYSYYHLISGEDYICKKAKDIYSYFESEQKEFVLFTNPSISSKDNDRVLYKHVMLGKLRTSKHKIVNKINFMIDNICVAIQKIFGKKKEIFFDVYQKGSQWFSITHEFARYIINNEELIEKAFTDTLIPDELFIQTLLINSPYFENIFDYKNFNNSIQNSRLIDWNRGTPYTFNEEDKDEILSSSCCFFRKVTNSNNLIYILNKSFREQDE